MGSIVGVMMAARIKAMIIATFLFSLSHFGETIPILAKKVVRTGSSKTPEYVGKYKDTTYPEKTQYRDDNRPTGANLPTLAEVAIRLIREYARGKERENVHYRSKIDGIQDYSEELFNAGWIPEDEYQDIQHAITQAKEPTECQ